MGGRRHFVHFLRSTWLPADIPNQNLCDAMSKVKLEVRKSKRKLFFICIKHVLREVIKRSFNFTELV